MRRGHRRALTVFEEHLRQLARAPRTRADHLREARRFLAALDEPLRRLRRPHVERHLAALEDLGVAASTQARVLSSLRVLCRALVHPGDRLPQAGPEG